MAEPGYLALRSDCQFAAGTREAVLEQWQSDIDQGQLNARFDAEVVSISGGQGAFSLGLKGGESIETKAGAATRPPARPSAAPPASW